MAINKPVTINSSSKAGGYISSYVAMVLSGLLGGVSMFLFIIFLYTGLPGQMDLGLNQQAILLFDTLLCALFFLQHSLMIREGFRKWLSGLIPQDYIGA
ncbi:MAG: hypothetical protein KJ630_20280, partial [Proteobacteria bacterium]|nr:hypothetical protein [Pseudomonadota bacterium]